MKRTPIIAGLMAAGVLVVAGGALSAAALTGNETPAKLGSELTRIDAVLDGPSVPLSAPLSEAVTGALPEIATTSARRVMVHGKDAVYVARSTKADDRLCIFAAREETDGVWSAATCAPRAAAGAGTMVVQLQERAGGLDTPRTYYGIVPDGVQTVNAVSWTGQSSASNGVYAIQRPNALDGPGVLEFHLKGRRITQRLG